jgi:hypothetical protein
MHTRYAGGLTLLVVYGHQVKSKDDPFLNLAEECVDILANHIASGGGIWPVDIFPARQSLFSAVIQTHLFRSQTPPPYTGTPYISLHRWDLPK